MGQLPSVPHSPPIPNPVDTVLRASARMQAPTVSWLQKVWPRPSHLGVNCLSLQPPASVEGAATGSAMAQWQGTVTVSEERALPRYGTQP